MISLRKYVFSVKSHVFIAWIVRFLPNMRR